MITFHYINAFVFFCNTIAQVQHMEENSLCYELVVLPCVAENITHQCNPKPRVLELFLILMT